MEPQLKSKRATCTTATSEMFRGNQPLQRVSALGPNAQQNAAAITPAGVGTHGHARAQQVLQHLHSTGLGTQRASQLGERGHAQVLVLLRGAIRNFG